MHTENAAGEMHMKMTWAVIGSLLINMMLGLAIAALFSVSPPAQASALQGCSGAHPEVHAGHSPAAPSRALSRHDGYLTAARMGWAI
jgi:hypothetical protein